MSEFEGASEDASLEDLFATTDLDRTAPQERRNPFKFLDPYTVEDRGLFFGRDADVKELYARFYGHRMTVVYGESGSGKSSLVQCGLGSEIPAEQAEFVVVRAAVDPLGALREELSRRVRGAVLPEDSVEMLREACYRLGKMLVIFYDQFEELFIQQTDTMRQTFARELQRWVTARLDLGVVLAVREEYLAQLTELESVVPEILSNRYWVRRMSQEQAEEAVIGPCEACGVRVERDVSRILLEDLGREGGGIELPYLQVVMDTLYQQAVKVDSAAPDITVELYRSQGGVRDILRGFIESRLAEFEDPEPVRQVLKAMVTSEGTKQVLGLRELSERAENFGEKIPEADLRTILNQLIDSRVLREDADNHLYELRHDSLAVQIHTWMTGLEKDLVEIRQIVDNRYREYESRDSLLDEQTLADVQVYESRLHLSRAKQAFLDDSRREIGRLRKRKIRMVASGIAAVFLALLGFTFWALRERTEAESQRAIAVQTLAQSDFSQAHSLLREGKDGQALAYLSRAIRQGSHQPSAVFLANLLINKTLFLPVAVVRHEGEVTTAAFSPDGHYVVTTSADSTARVWDAVTGMAVGQPMKHEGRVETAAFSPDGHYVVTASEDGTARLWDAVTGVAVGQPMKHEGRMETAAFSPDGHYVVTASRDSTARVWDAVTGMAVGQPMKHEGRVETAAFSPDGHYVVTASEDGTARVWNAITSAAVGQPMGHKRRVWSAAFSPGGRYVVTASEDNTARLWNAATGVLVGQPMMHKGSTVTTAAFSPDGRYVVTASWDGVRVWDAATGVAVGQPMMHGGVVITAQFSPDGRYVVTASVDNTARLWNATTGVAMGQPMVHDRRVWSATFSPDGRYVVTASEDGTARVWEMVASAAVGQPMIHEKAVATAAFSPDGRYVVTASSDSTARVWEAATGVPVGQPMMHEELVATAQFSPDGRYVVTASWDSTARVWEAATGMAVGQSMMHGDVVATAQFSPDGRYVVTASWDSTAKVWEAATGVAVGQPMMHGGVVITAAFSPDGRYVVTASVDRTARMWNAITGVVVGQPMRHKGRVRSAAFSPDGRYVITASEDGTTRLWDAATGVPVGQPMMHGDERATAAFSPDGRYVVTASVDRTARLWDAATGVPVGQPMMHEGAVATAQFSPDGRYVVTASWDGTTRVWDAATGVPAGQPMMHERSVVTAAFSPDGRYVVTASWDGTARLWEFFSFVEPSSLMARWGEVVGGYRLNEQGTMVRMENQIEKISNFKEEVVRTGKDDPAAGIISWFFADKSRRTIAPGFSIEVPEYVDLMVERNTRGSLSQALDMDPGNPRALSLYAANNQMSACRSYMELRQNNRALIACRRAVDAYGDLVEDDMQNEALKRELAIACGDLALLELLDGNNLNAISASLRGLESDSTQVWIEINLAHGYLFTDQYEKAREIYHGNKDVKINGGRQTFGEVVLEDFEKFRDKGIEHPDLMRIEALMQSTPE